MELLTVFKKVILHPLVASISTAKFVLCNNPLALISLTCISPLKNSAEMSHSSVAPLTSSTSHEASLSYASFILHMDHRVSQL